MIRKASRRVKAVLKTAAGGDRQRRSQLVRLWGLADVLGLEPVSLRDTRSVDRPSPPTSQPKDGGDPR